MKNSERIAALILSLIGIGVMYYAWGTLKIGSIHAPDAGFLPFVTGTALTILGGLWAAAAKRKDKGQQGRPWRPALCLLLMLLYAWSIENIGYITSTLLFMIAWEQLVERERWVKTMVIAVVSTAAMYALFGVFLRVPIPAEFFLR